MPHPLQIHTEGNADASDLSVLPSVVGEEATEVGSEKSEGVLGEGGALSLCRQQDRITDAVNIHLFIRIITKHYPLRDAQASYLYVTKGSSMFGTTGG
ncbi:unnamed protein product [Prunus armeniaca]|uniref:Uncharacterized protein n=2 Tax=Prunus armeniaca TaxID=36596 RepID=A0A6J5WZ93_PRUAR|nr:unnamed protein product [Prunus armeniaca]